MQLKLWGLSSLLLAVVGCDVVWQSYISTYSADCSPDAQVCNPAADCPVQVALCAQARGGIDAGTYPLPTSCDDLKQQGYITDMTYTVYLNRDPSKPFQILCHDLQGTPTAYLMLPSSAPMANVSSYAQVPGSLFTTQYKCLPIDPLTLIVGCDDQRCATVSGTPSAYPDASTGSLVQVKSMPFATVVACVGAMVTGNIDLRGTPLSVPGTALAASGSGQTMANFSFNNQVVSLAAKGATCGKETPTPLVMDPFNQSGLKLQLAYGP